MVEGGSSGERKSLVIRLHNSVSTIVIIMRTRVEGATINAISGSEGVDRMKYPRGIKQSVSNCRNCHRSAHPSLSWNRNPLELATHPLCPLSRDPPYAAPHLSSSAASPPLFSARSALRQLTRPATFREEVEPNSHRRDTGRDRAKGKWSSTYRKDIVGGMEMARGSTTEVEVVLTVQSRGRRVRVCQPGFHCLWRRSPVEATRPTGLLWPRTCVLWPATSCV